jgi:hypothetical protein
MAFAQVSAHHDHPVRPSIERFEYQVGVNHTRAHDAYCAHVGRVLQPGYPCQIAPGISAPVAEKTQDHRFKFKFFPHSTLLCENIAIHEILSIAFYSLVTREKFVHVFFPLEARKKLGRVF